MGMAFSKKMRAAVAGTALALSGCGTAGMVDPPDAAVEVRNVPPGSRDGCNVITGSPNSIRPWNRFFATSSGILYDSLSESCDPVDTVKFYSSDFNNGAPFLVSSETGYMQNFSKGRIVFTPRKTQCGGPVETIKAYDTETQKMTDLGFGTPDGVVDPSPAILAKDLLYYSSPSAIQGKVDINVYDLGTGQTKTIATASPDIWINPPVASTKAIITLPVSGDINSLDIVYMDGSRRTIAVGSPYPLATLGEDYVAVSDGAGKVSLFSLETAQLVGSFGLDVNGQFAIVNNKLAYLDQNSALSVYDPATNSTKVTSLADLLRDCGPDVQSILPGQTAGIAPMLMLLPNDDTSVILTVDTVFGVDFNVNGAKGNPVYKVIDI